MNEQLQFHQEDFFTKKTSDSDHLDTTVLEIIESKNWKLFRPKENLSEHQINTRCAFCLKSCDFSQVQL